MNPEELSERIGIQFQTGHDDLDTLDWARVIGLSGRPYVLVRHRNSPEPGTQIVVPYNSNDPSADVQDVLNGLNLSQRDLTWTSADVVSRQGKGIRAVRRPSKKRPARRLRVKALVTNRRKARRLSAALTPKVSVFRRKRTKKAARKK